MSTQKGNMKKAGPPKYQNKTKFRNDLHDSSHRTKSLNALDISGVCVRCKAVIEYKQLTQPKKCVKCGNKSVKNSYFTVCKPCADQQQICGKCGQKEDLVSLEDEQGDNSCCSSDCD